MGINAVQAKSENRPKRPKTQMSAGKVLASVSWATHGILFIDYLEKGRTIKSEYYMALLVRLKKEMAKKVLFHQDNAPCHKSTATKATLHELLLYPCSKK